MSAPEPLLSLDGVTVAWERRPVVEEIRLEVGEGEFVTLLGPNGSGKTTLLRAIAGFQPLRAGTVRLGGRDLAGVPPHRRSIGILFQEPSLFPRRSVFANIAYAPLLQRRPAPDVRAEVDSLAELLGLDRLLDRSPTALSGGERQRVALARTLAARPRLVLLDEPFASIDPELRTGLHAQFRRALAERRTAAIHVTHDREEALFLGDRVALLLDGRLASVGRPRELFDRPPDARAARFLGYNVVRDGGETVAVLPEDVAVGPSPGPFAIVVSGTTGRGYRAVLENPDGDRVEARGPEAFPTSGSYAIAWRRTLPLGRSDGPAERAQNPRSPPR